MRCLTPRDDEDEIDADFNEVRLHEAPLNNTMLDIRMMVKENPLNLRNKTGLDPEGLDLYAFIAALKQ